MAEQNANMDELIRAMGLLRMYGFALVHYGGDALHKATGAPVANMTWRTDLATATNAIAENAAAAHQLAQAIEHHLFDLNKAGTAGVDIAAGIASSFLRAS